MYDDDDAGTKVPLTRIRPSFVARLRRSDSEPRALEAAENELAESTATVTSLATSAVPDQSLGSTRISFVSVCGNQLSTVQE